MDPTNEGNSFHFCENFEEPLEDKAASSQELGGRRLEQHLKTIPLEQLNTALRQFYAKVKTEKKGMLTPSALTGILVLIVITLFYLGDIDIYGPYFSFMSLQCHLCRK